MPTLIEFYYGIQVSQIERKKRRLPARLFALKPSNSIHT